MNILVNDVAASTSGALTVLMQFYPKFKADKKNQYVLCISTPPLEPGDNITVLRFPWVKKSWAHRLYFDFIYVKRILKQYKIEQVLSLQNTMIVSNGLPQTVYLHQAIPFAKYKFKFSDNRLLWVYQNIISKIIFYSLKHSENIIVQVKWIKECIVQQLGVDSTKIRVISPDVDLCDVKAFINSDMAFYNFFYPATPFNYKNHDLILEACKKICCKDKKNFKVYITISGEENRYAKEIKQKIIKYKIPVFLIGTLPREQVFCWYQKSVLLFPSFVESHPMPLKEARQAGTPILASNLQFSKEILDGYSRAAFFEPDDADDLALKMLAIMENKDGNFD